MSTINSIEELDRLYGKPTAPSVIKEVSYLTPEYQKLIALSPMMMLATSGPEGLDCTPRGDKRGFVRIIDETTLVFPDRRGNNRADSLRNIIRDPRVATLFLIPGLGTTLRVNGSASISTDDALLSSFSIEGKSPRTVVIIKVERAFFHCARAFVRSGLWDPDLFVEPSQAPSPGQILAALSDNEHGGKQYDESWAERAKETLW